MSLIDELKEWKEDLETLTTERVKAEGRLEQAMESLKELGYNSVEEAKVALDALTVKLTEAEQEAKDLIETFKEKYAEHIEV